LEILVKEFYYKNYFTDIKLDKLNEVDIVVELFDIAVNMGPKTAIDFLQRSLNLLNNSQKLYKDIVVDGDFGNTSYNTYKVYMASRNVKNNAKILIKALNGFQFNRYVKICEMNPTQEIFFYG
jgi:lysozyme family protein